MSACEVEYAQMLALEDGDPLQYEEARRRYHACIRRESSMARVRTAHGLDWDEKLYIMQKELEAIWNALFEELDIPPRPCDERTSELRADICQTKKQAMVFSKKIAEAFSESGISLNDDETFACSICVVKKPKYISDAKTLDPLQQNQAGAPQVNYIFEPSVMEPLMSDISKNRIKYDS